MRILFCCLFGLLLALPLRAEDLLPRVQRLLRAQKFYFGEIDGRANEETVEAIRKFQEAKGIDQTKQLDRETLRALGLADAAQSDSAEAKQLEECNTCVLHYLQAWQEGVWEREAVFFSDVVNYYDDQNVSRDFIRGVRVRENQRWPRRKSTMLNRIASAAGPNQVQVTARVRTEVGGETGPSRVRTEDLLFRLEKTKDGWRIGALKLLE